MKKAKRWWLMFIMAWGTLLDFAPKPVEHDFDMSMKSNTISSHFDAAWRYLGNAIASGNR